MRSRPCKNYQAGTIRPILTAGLGALPIFDENLITFRSVLNKHPYYDSLDKVDMKERIDPVVFLDGIINALKSRSENQDEIDDHIVLTKLADKIREVKKQYLFEIAQHEYALALARQ